MLLGQLVDVDTTTAAILELVRDSFALMTRDRCHSARFRGLDCATHRESLGDGAAGDSALVSVHFAILRSLEFLSLGFGVFTE